MITLIARLTAKEDEFDKLREVTMEMSQAVASNEPGNVLYAVTEGAGDRQLILIERYRDEAALDAHRSSQHFRTIGKQLAPTLAGPPEILFRLTDCA